MQPPKAFPAKSAAEMVLRSIKHYNEHLDNNPAYDPQTMDDSARLRMAGSLLHIHWLASDYNVGQYLLDHGHASASDEVTAFLALNDSRFARRLLTRFVSPASAYQTNRIKAASDALILLNPFAKPVSWFLEAGRCGPDRSAEIAVNQFRARVRRRSPLWAKRGADSTRNNQGWAAPIDPDSGAYYAETAYYSYAQAEGDALYMYKAQAWAYWRYANALAEQGLERCPFEGVTINELWRDNEHSDDMHGKRWLELAMADFGRKVGIELPAATALRTLQALSSPRARSKHGLIAGFRVLPFYPDADRCLRVHVDHPLYSETRRGGGHRPYTTVGMMARILYHAHQRFDPSLPDLPTDKSSSVNGEQP